MNMEEMIKSPATSVMMFRRPDQGKFAQSAGRDRKPHYHRRYIGQRGEGRSRSSEEGCYCHWQEAQPGHHLHISIGEQVASALVKDDAAEAKVTSDVDIHLKEPPKLRSTDFSEGHTD